MEYLLEGWQTAGVRLLLACLLGGIIGFDREKRGGQNAGTRTYIIVSVSGCLCMLISLFADADLGKIDLGRLPAAMVSGMGFLGAGVIWKNSSQEIKGLTTAAGLWGSSLVGIAVGAGYYTGALIAFALLFFAVVALEHAEQRVDGRQDRETVYIELSSRSRLKDVLTVIDEKGARASDLKIEKLDTEPLGAVAVTLLVDENGRADIRDVLECIGNLDGVTFSVDI